MLKKLEILKIEYGLQYKYIAKGAIIHSRARSYQSKGRKVTSIFLNLESPRGKKLQFRKIIREDKSLTRNPKVIMGQRKVIYSNLYQANST